jgi:hypothetical protein
MSPFWHGTALSGPAPGRLLPDHVASTRDTSIAPHYCPLTISLPSLSQSPPSRSAATPWGPGPPSSPAARPRSRCFPPPFFPAFRSGPTQSQRPWQPPSPVCPPGPHTDFRACRAHPGRVARQVRAGPPAGSCGPPAPPTCPPSDPARRRVRVRACGRVRAAGGRCTGTGTRGRWGLGTCRTTWGTRYRRRRTWPTT